ncbi:Protein of unknown function (DUF3068) [Murinocardiopsis flavida]|uniref:DUF3068 family protein n=1 Tax=Murinocardiopsis flavida TaxID=645275 RepID=A0A2P8DIW2_9ACTN|nr:DUF3068 domain-containing protein [Murinocardiopsis flavida]PSK97167.1 Protein of unknown function (DUF3068) [Murinocardiopsis flavida]
MRRTVAVVCIALGVFCIALAPLLRYWVAPTFMKTPLDYYSTLVNRTDDATYFSAKDLEQIDNAEVEATTTLRADVAASNDDVVVFDGFTWVKDVGTDFAFLSTSRRIAHDRENGLAVDCCDNSINEKSVNPSGQAFKWPFLVEKKDYEFFDPTIADSSTIEFEGEEEVKGVPTYKFVQRIEPTKIGERTLPKKLLELKGKGDVEADEMYSITRTYWVEPTTGVGVDLIEDQHRAAVVDGEERLILFDGEMRFDEKTVSQQLKTASQSSRLTLARTTGPIILLGVGVVLFAGGVILTFVGASRSRGRRG